MGTSELFYLKWNNFQKNIRRMRDEEDLVDITFACEGKKIGAHKLVLFSCSPYFKDLLASNKSSHPIFFFHDISYDILKAILEYMYMGEVHITNENLKDFIRVAEALQIRGLSKDTSTTDEVDNNTNLTEIEDDFVRKRTNTNEEQHNIQTSFTPQGKRLRIISEQSSLANTLNDDEDMEEEVHQPASTTRIQQQQHHHQQQQNISSNTVKRDTQSVQPKIESLEFLEEAVPTHIQHVQQTLGNKNVNVTYMNIENYNDKNNSVTTSNASSNQQQHVVATQFIQAGTSQQQSQATSVEYKSEDEIWEKTMEIGSGSNENSSKRSKKDNSYKANCLTPRSCPVCARVYSNVSNLRQHMRLIHNPTAVVCPICQKHFNSDLYLKRHYSSIHSINNTSGEGESGSESKPNTNSATANQSGNWTYSDSILQQ